MKKEKLTIMILSIVFILFTCPCIVKAVDYQNTTSDINGVTAQWEYTLDDAGNIENLKCKNATELKGNITVPAQLANKTVVEIGYEAFKSATSITGVTISSSIKSIEYSAFEGCTSLTSVNLGNVTDLSFSIFKGCTNLKSITIPKTVKNGPTSSCLDNPNITNITLQEGLTIIPTYLCANTGITSITIPNSVKGIEYSAFKNCSNLSNVNLGSVEEISFDVFKDCPKLKEIKIPKTLVEGVEISDAPVFSGTTVLTSATFEDGLTEIPGSILKGCSGITSVKIPNTVTKIGPYAFEGTSISEIDIPNSVKEIGVDAFKDCSKLKKATILDNCQKLGWFILYPNKDTIFTNHNADLTIYCYEGSKIAEYAISTKIKYEYLKKPASGTGGTTEKPKEEEPSGGNEGGNTGKDTSKGQEQDKTTAKGTLPYAGLGMGLAGLVAIVALGGIYTYYKYNRLKDI